jgi:chromosome segregation ATPase
VIGNGSSAAKKTRTEANGGGTGHPPHATGDTGHMDLTNSEHVVTVTQLKEQIENLKKQLSKKDQELIEKDKKIAELTAKQKREEREWREKLTSHQKSNSEKFDTLQQRMANLQKQNASLAKAGKKQYSNITPNDSPLLTA